MIKQIKKIKMLLYGTPGVGKSMFALRFPRPFFITTDGNYEWLEDFGAKPQDHKQVSSWTEFVNFVAGNDFKNYDTVVIDLIEDLFSWMENEYVKKNKLEYIGDQAYGKGYKITRDEFYVKMSKLISLDKNVIFLSHETEKISKDKRGIETTQFYPSSVLPENLRLRLEGNLRYVLRAKFEDIVEGQDIKQKRVLSLAKNSAEFSIIRGVNMDEIPEFIDLNFDEFVRVLKLEKRPQFVDVEKLQAETNNKIKDFENLKQVKVAEVETIKEVKPAAPEPVKVVEIQPEIKPAEVVKEVKTEAIKKVIKPVEPVEQEASAAAPEVETKAQENETEKTAEQLQKEAILAALAKLKGAK